MSNKYEIPIFLVSAQVDLNAAADKATFIMPMFRTILYQVGVLCTTADAGGATVKFDRRILAGSDTGRGDGDAGVVVIPAADRSGKFLIDTAFRGLAIQPGDQIVMEVTAEGVSANAFAFGAVWLQYDPEVVGNLGDVIET